MPRQERMTVPPGGDNGKAEAPGPPVRPPVSAAVLLLYNAIYLIGFCLYLPLFLWKVLGDRSYRSGMRQRMGHVPVPPSFPVVWVHGVSVGEVKAAEPLVHALEQERPELSFVISSTTPTGYRVACRLYGEERVIYYPIDFGPFPGRALDRIHPVCILLVELELWPNLLHAAERRGVPVAVVNGRISRRSFRGYNLVRRLLPQLDRIDVFCVQNRTYGERLQSLGVRSDAIFTTGNLKYDCLPVRSEGVV
ncbi:MAG: 3-deoxy-D-manno-octulosonic acid transferase, partial [Planctomycetota bacterium]